MGNRSPETPPGFVPPRGTLLLPPSIPVKRLTDVGQDLWADRGASPGRSHLLALFSASFSLAQLELHVPTGLNKLEAVEGQEVVLPAWYTMTPEQSSSQPWEEPLLMWFLEQEGKELNQVRGKS